MATPSPLPLMPDDGRKFINGSIDSDVYLRDKRAQARAKATSEVEHGRLSVRSTRYGTIGVFVAIVGNFGIGVASLFAGDLKVGAFGIATAGLMGAAFSVLMPMALRRKR